MINQVKQLIKDHALIQKGDTIVIGISGGADSTALAHILASLRHSLGIRLHMAHYNHHVRKGAKADQDFVKRLSGKLNIPLTIGERQGNLSDQLSEEDMRNLRMEFFSQVTKARRAQSVALAHSENDVAESVLMRMIRGSGLYGLRSILPKRSMNGMVLIRPLLTSSRFNIEQYLKQHKLAFRTDESNANVKFLRNRVRLELLPLLTAYNPQITHVLSDMAQVVSEDYDFLEGALKKTKSKIINTKGESKIPLKVINGEHASLRRLLLRHMVDHASSQKVVLAFDQVLKLEELLVNKSKSPYIDLPQGLRATKTKSFLEIKL